MMILMSFWFFSKTPLIFGRIFLRIVTSSMCSYTFTTAINAAFCSSGRESIYKLKNGT